MSTPTPRTDAAWARVFNLPEFSAAHTARTMRDECAKIEHELSVSRNAERLARVQLGAEREKVKTLREACESIEEQWDKNHSANPFHAGNVMQSHAMRALAATEDAQ